MRSLKHLLVSFTTLAGVLAFIAAPAFTVWGVILALALRRRRPTMPILNRKAGDVKADVWPEMTVRFRVNKCEFRDVAQLKADGKIKAESDLNDGLNLDLVVQDEGEYFGRHLFDGVDLDGQFAHRCRQFLDAIEYPDDEDIDTDRITDAEFIGVVGVQPESKDGQYPARNRIKKFLKVE